MPIQEHGYLEQTPAQLQEAKVQANAQRAERTKLRAEESVEAMSDYLAEVRHRREVTAKLRAERIAREASPEAPVALIAEVPIKVKAKAKPKARPKAKATRKPRKLNS